MGKTSAAAIIGLLPHELLTKDHTVQRTPMYRITLADGTVVDRHDQRLICISAVADCPKDFVKLLSWRDDVDVESMKYERDAKKVRAALNNTLLFDALGEYAMLNIMHEIFGGTTGIYWLIERCVHTGEDSAAAKAGKTAKHIVNSLEWRQAAIKGITYQCLQNVIWHNVKERKNSKGKVQPAVHKERVWLSMEGGRMIVDEADFGMGAPSDYHKVYLITCYFHQKYFM
jgi:hypothetical protein